MQVLVSGLVLFLAMERALERTANLHFLPSLILLGAFLIPVTFVVYVGERVALRAVPFTPLVICCLWGGAVGTIVAGVLEYATLRRLGFLLLLGVGLIEESAKLIVPLGFYAQGRYRTAAHGLLFGVASGMGFAALETMGYAFVALIESGGSVGALHATLFARGLLAPAGHAAWTGLACAVAWRERERRGRWVLNQATLRAFAAAVMLHALWDTCVNLSSAAGGAWLLAGVPAVAIACLSFSLLMHRVREATGPSAHSERPEPAGRGPAAA